MEYISTRGSAPALDFAGATLAGLASDGGLYDVATRMGRAIPGYPDFRPKFVAEIRKAPEADEAGE